MRQQSYHGAVSVVATVPSSDLSGAYIANERVVRVKSSA